MNNRIISTLLLAVFLGLGLLSGCEKEIEFSGELKKPKLVLNCLFNTDSIWAVKLSNSLSVIDQLNPGPVEGATIEILDGSGNLLEALSEISPGQYVSPTGLQPVAGNIYQVRASKANFTTVTATNYTPQPVSILAWDTVRTVDGDGTELLEVTVRIQDNAAEENFYVLGMPYTSMDIYGTDTFIYSYPVYMQTNDPIVNQTFDAEPGYTPSYPQLLFTDVLFSGGTYNLKFQVDPYTFVYGQFGDTQLDLVLYSCTEDFYRYLVSFDAYQAVSGNPFAQPVQVYSNVENGFGIFAGTSVFKVNLIQ